MYDVQVPFPFAASISTGGATARVSTLGNNPSVDTSTQPEDVWSGAVLGVLNSIDHKFIPKPQTPTSMEIVSDSANDTAAGTGARTVAVVYLDANYASKTTVLTMNGVTPVALPETVMRVNMVAVSTSGTFGGNNIGNISIRAAGGLGATYQYLIAGLGFARSSMFTVPDKVSVDLMSIFVSINRVDTNVRAATFSLCNQNQAGRLIKGLELAITSDNPYRHEAAGVPLINYAARTDFWLRCEAVSLSGTNVTGSLFGYTRNPVNFTL
jgi:hypothetical protein